MSGVESALLSLKAAGGAPGSWSTAPDDPDNLGASDSLNSLGYLGLITLSDPLGNGNALNTELLNGLIRLLAAWRKQPVRAIVLRSGSPDAFSVGMDFAVFRAQDGPDAREQAAALYRRCLDSIYRFPAPVFCLLEKAARAGGAGLVLAADLVLATREASLSLGEALFGLIPASVLPYLRMRLPERRANRIVFVPEALDARTLFDWGLIDFAPLADVAELEKLLKKLLRSVLRCSPQALARQKSFTQQISGLPLEQQQDLAEATLIDCLNDPAVQAGIEAFLSDSLGPWNARLSKETNLG